MDLEQFRLSKTDEKTILASRPKRRRVRRRQSWFLKGPVDGDWLGLAAKLPGKSIVVGLVIWHGMAMESQGGKLKLTRRLLNRLNVGRRAASSGLRHLESAGLLKVNRRRGRSPVVEITYPNGHE
jgi:hypothetical protein